MERGEQWKSTSEKQWGFLEVCIVTKYPNPKLRCCFVSHALTDNKLFRDVTQKVSQEDSSLEDCIYLSAVVQRQHHPQRYCS